MIKFCRFRRHEYDGDTNRQCPVCKQVTDRDFSRRWRVSNPEKARQYHKESYSRRDKKQLAERARQGAIAHPEQRRMQKRKNNQIRHARKRMTTVEPVEPVVVWEKSNGRCFCGDEVSVFRMQMDHIIPLSRGGTHTYDNLRAAHPDCNNWKNGRLDSEIVYG